MIDKFSDEFDFLSNFYPVEVRPITIHDTYVFPSVEHAYQAGKQLDNIHLQPQILKNNEEKPSVFLHGTSGQAKRAGKKLIMQPDWNTEINNLNPIKFRFMRELVTIKFYENEDLCAKLLETGDEELIEGNWWGDKYWGVCKGEGENNLGKILMAIRLQLQD